MIVVRARRFAFWMSGIGVAVLAPLTCASAQNLDAGKSAAQIFSEACSGCHRSPREVRGNPSAGFLREHYTTGSEMASTMAAYLAGSADPRGPSAVQPKQKSAPASANRDPTPAAETPRRAQTEPKAPPGGASRNRPAAVTTDAKLPNPTPPAPAPARPVLEEFEE